MDASKHTPICLAIYPHSVPGSIAPALNINIWIVQLNLSNIICIFIMFPSSKTFCPSNKPGNCPSQPWTADKSINAVPVVAQQPAQQRVTSARYDSSCRSLQPNHLIFSCERMPVHEEGYWKLPKSNSTKLEALTEY